MAEAAAKQDDVQRLRIPFEEYVELDAINASSLKDFATSPLLYWYRKQKPRDDTDTLRKGRALHTAVLEPDRFALEYTVFRGARRQGKKWEAFAEANSDKTILTEKQHDDVVTMRKAVRADEAAQRYLSQKGEAEVTVTWRHEGTGLLCKSRIDYLCSVALDLKSTSAEDPAAFGRQAYRLGYLIQFAMYADAVAALTGEALPFKVIAPQNLEPFDVFVLNVPEELLARGRVAYNGLMERLASCIERGDWPGVTDGKEVELELPSWATPNDEDDETPDEIPDSIIPF